MGAAIGDALGMPVETMPQAEIMQLTRGQGITGFIDGAQRRIGGTGDLKAGGTTDDWQLTRVVAESIIRSEGRFDLGMCAAMHVRALETTAFGWGKTTERAIREIKEGKRSATEPAGDFGPKSGGGNGVAMKIAPIAIAESWALRDSDFDAVCESIWNAASALGKLTHSDPRASLAAYAVAIGISLALREEFPFEGTWGTHRAITRVRSLVFAREFELEIGEPALSERILRLMNGGKMPLQDLVGSGFLAIETAPFALGTFLRHPRSFREGVLEAANAGGDTDTNASVVGALIGANVGLEGIPGEWRTFDPVFEEAADIAETLLVSVDKRK